MLAIKLDPEMEKHVIQLAERRGLSLDSLLQEAVERMVEDLEDVAAAEEALRDYDPSQNVSLEDLRRELGLDD